MTERNWAAEFGRAASTFDRSTLATLSREYTADLYAVAEPPDVGHVLQVLRQTLRYEDLELVADAALAHRPDAPVVRRLYAQALVDGANPAVALQLYSDLAADQTVPPSDRIEARGGIGRCYKEMFLALYRTGPAAALPHPVARRVPGRLPRGRERTPGTGSTPWRCWRAPSREGVEVAPDATGADRPGRAHPADRRRGPCAATCGPRSPPARRPSPSAGTTRRSSGRGRSSRRDPDGFTVAAFLRQLQTVWQLTTTGSPGDELLPVLRSTLLAEQRGRGDGGVGRRPRCPSCRLRPRTAGEDPRRRALSCRWPGTARAAALPGRGPDRDGRRGRHRHRIPRRRARSAPGPARRAWWSPMVTSSPRTSTPPTRSWCSTASTTIRASRPTSG